MCLDLDPCSHIRFRSGSERVLRISEAGNFREWNPYT